MSIYDADYCVCEVCGTEVGPHDPDICDRCAEDLEAKAHMDLAAAAYDEHRLEAEKTWGQS